MKGGILEGLALVEYKPKINEKWRVYSSLQGLYGHTLKPYMHARSYIMARAGVSYREFSFGFGTNFDWYGPMKQNNNSFGGFLSVALF